MSFNSKSNLFITIHLTKLYFFIFCKAKCHNKGSGKAPATCAFYQELNATEGNNANINPIAVRSSLSIGSSKDFVDSDSEEGGEDDVDFETGEDGDQTVPSENNKKVEKEKRKRKYESTVSKSTKSLISWLEDWKREQETKLEEDQIREEEHQTEILERMDRLERIAEEKNDILK